MPRLLDMVKVLSFALQEGKVGCSSMTIVLIVIINMIIMSIVIITIIIKIILRLQFTVMPALGGLGCSWPATLSTTSGNS